jgi:hypothetical protein
MNVQGLGGVLLRQRDLRILAILHPQPASLGERRLAGQRGNAVAEPEILIRGFNWRHSAGSKYLNAGTSSAPSSAKPGRGSNCSAPRNSPTISRTPLQPSRWIEVGELPHGVRLADEIRHHEMRSVVRRAEHDEARPFPLHHLVPQAGIFPDHGASDEAPHAVRKDANGHGRRPVGIEQRTELRRERRGEIVERETPVVRKGLDPVRSREKFAEVAVEPWKQDFRSDTGASPTNLREPS